MTMFSARVDDEEQALAEIADWGPAEDWSDWAEAAGWGLVRSHTKW
jgi:hypothetical protein